MHRQARTCDVASRSTSLCTTLMQTVQRAGRVLDHPQPARACAPAGWQTSARASTALRDRAARRLPAPRRPPARRPAAPPCMAGTRPRAPVQKRPSSAPHSPQRCYCFGGDLMLMAPATCSLRALCCRFARRPAAPPGGRAPRAPVHSRPYSALTNPTGAIYCFGSETSCATCSLRAPGSPFAWRPAAPPGTAGARPPPPAAQSSARSHLDPGDCSNSWE